MKRKLDDFERIDKVQRTLNDHNSALENELKKLKVKYRHFDNFLSFDLIKMFLILDWIILNCLLNQKLHQHD